MKKILVLIILLSSVSTYAYVDLNISYTQSIRKIEGVETDENPEPGSAQTTSVGYAINWAWYIWEYTALELNYSKTTERLKDDREVATDDDSLTILAIDSTVITEVSGVGLRQSFASRKAAIIPSLSLGYAQFSTSGLAVYQLDDAGVEKELEVEQDTEVFSSSYAALSVRIRITELMGFTLAAKTVMPEFDTSVAGNNVTYSAGFSWIF